MHLIFFVFFPTVPVVLSADQIGFTEGFNGVLDRIRVTISDVKRVFNLARPYNTSKGTMYTLDSPTKDQALANVESICDGFAFPAEYWDTGDPTINSTRRRPPHCGVLFRNEANAS